MSTLDDQVPKEVAVSADSILAATAKLGTRAADSPPASFRMLLISLLSAAIGRVAGILAFPLYKLIEVFTNLFFFHRWSADFARATQPLGLDGHRHSGYRRQSRSVLEVHSGRRVPSFKLVVRSARSSVKPSIPWKSKCKAEVGPA